MRVIVGVSLAVIAGVVFYRFVERQHKIVVAKVAGGLVVLSMLGAAALAYTTTRNAAATEARRTSVHVRWVPPDSGADSSRVRNPFVQYTDTLDAITFELCNRGRDTVAAVSFSANTFRRGRSTTYPVPITPAGGPYQPNEFTSDYILAPEQCVELTWSGGRYVVLDSAFASPTEVTGMNR